MSQPAVSVAMAVYNTERYLAQAIESILDQTFSDFKFIIIDDGSTDGSKAIIERYAGQDGRIVFRSRANRGIVATRNEILSLAGGEFLAVMDSDDIAMPDRLALQVQYLNDHRDCVIVGTGVELIDPDGDLLGPYPVELEHDKIDALLLKGHFAIIHSSAMLRRQAVVDIGGYTCAYVNVTINGQQKRYVFYEDLDLYLRLAERGLVANLPQRLLQFRRHPASTTGISSFEAAMARRMQVVGDAYARRGLDPGTMDVHRAPRPTSLAQWHTLTAWIAFNHRQYRAARKHWRRAMIRRPLALNNWRLGVNLYLGPWLGESIFRLWKKLVLWTRRSPSSTSAKP